MRGLLMCLLIVCTTWSSGLGGSWRAGKVLSSWSAKYLPVAGLMTVTDRSVTFQVTKDRSDKPSTKYQILYREGADGAWVAYNSPSSYASAFPDIGQVVITGLKPSTEYFIKVLVNDKPRGKVVKIVTKAAELESWSARYLPVAGLMAVTDRSVTFQVTKDSSDKPSTKYQIFYKEGTNGAWVAYNNPSSYASAFPNLGQVVITGLKPSTEYFIKVLVNDKPRGKVVKIVTKAAEIESWSASYLPVAGLMAVTDRSVTFQVTKDGSDKPSTKYQILYKEGADGAWVSYNNPSSYASAFPNMGQVEITGLKPSTEYFIMVLVNDKQRGKVVKIVTKS